MVQTTAPTAQVVNVLQVRLPAHPNHQPNPNITHHIRRWRRCSLAGLSCLPRRDLVARHRLELPAVVDRAAAAAWAAADGGGVSGVSASAWLCMSRTACYVPSRHFAVLCLILGVVLPPPDSLHDPSRSCVGGRDVWVALSERVRNVIKVLLKSRRCRPPRAAPRHVPSAVERCGLPWEP